MSVTVVICALSEVVTAVQLLPLAVGSLLMGLDIWGEKSLETPITVLALLMALINGAILSVVDVAIWALVAFAFFPRK